METGFLNPIHDEEHFSSTFYNQGNGLDDSEHMLFGEMIVPEIIDYDNLWQSVDDLETPSQQNGETGTRKEDFQKLLFEWQNQLTYMQEPEVIKQIIPVSPKTTQEVSDMFSNRTSISSTPTDPSIDELFPPETNKEISVVEFNELSRDTSVEGTSPFAEEEMAAATQIKIEPEEQSEVQIKVEREEQTVDVETVGEEVPLLMAADLATLLEQFEATEKVNSAQSPSPPRLSSQTIRDALPADLISRIKATRENHKKMISVIPAMPNKRQGRAATRMQDAGAALSRNKLLKLVTGGSSGESVQLDHDYCTNGDTTSNSSRSCYVSDSSEYPSQSSTPDTVYSRLPEYYMAMATQKAKERVRLDNGSRKDSGLESGENSDEENPPASEVKSKVVLKSVSGLKSINVVTENGVVIGSAPVVRNNGQVSLLKKNIGLVEKDNKNCSAIPVSECILPVTSCIKIEVEEQVAGKKKKKLNLEEYRVRREEREKIQSQESSRANSPVTCETPPAQPDSTSVSLESVPKKKPVRLSVEVQTQTCDFIDLTSSKSPQEQKSRTDRKEKRNDLKHRSYRSRHASSSSSSSSAGSNRHHSHRRKKSHKHRKCSVSRMWSRSPSRSTSRSHSPASSRSRSRSKSRGRRQKWRSRSPHRSHARYSNTKNFISRDRTWQQRARSPVRAMRNQEFGSQEKVRQVEERRVIYVGRIDEGTSKADLRKRFQQFGPIVDISVHFRERGDNYGFVTFAHKADAYKAVEHGNDDPKLARYDLCFGGRRAFCKQRYADLDGLATSIHNQYGSPIPQQRSNESFDLLLHEVKAQLRKRSSV